MQCHCLPHSMRTCSVADEVEQLRAKTIRTNLHESLLSCVGEAVRGVSMCAIVFLLPTGQGVKLRSKRG